MPKPIMVSCDSACDLSDEMRERYAIQVTSMYIHQDGKVFRDGIDITPDDIYATYEEKGVLPTRKAKRNSSAACSNLVPLRGLL